MVGEEAYAELGARLPAPLDRRARLFGITNFLGMGGGALTAVAAAWLLDRRGFPGGYVLCFAAAALLNFLSWFFLALVREPPSEHPTAGVSQREYWRRLPAILQHDANFRRYLLSQVVRNVGGMATGFLAVYEETREEKIETKPLPTPASRAISSSPSDVTTRSPKRRLSSGVGATPAPNRSRRIAHSDRRDALPRLLKLYRSPPAPREHIREQIAPLIAFTFGRGEQTRTFLEAFQGDLGAPEHAWLAYEVFREWMDQRRNDRPIDGDGNDDLYVGTGMCGTGQTGPRGTAFGSVSTSDANSGP